jgi:hypothetical protein
MVQRITSKTYGDFDIVRSWGDASRHIVELPNGSFCRWGGEPIQHRQELIDLIPEGKHLAKALAWWDNKDVEAPEDEDHPVGWTGGKLVFLDTGKPLTSVEEVLKVFREPGPFQQAALQTILAQLPQANAALELANTLQFHGEGPQDPNRPTPGESVEALPPKTTTSSAAMPPKKRRTLNYD